MSEAVETEEGLRRNSARVQRLTRSDEEEAEQDQDITDEEDEEKKGNKYFMSDMNFSNINTAKSTRSVVVKFF